MKLSRTIINYPYLDKTIQNHWELMSISGDATPKWFSARRCKNITRTFVCLPGHPTGDGMHSDQLLRPQWPQCGAEYSRISSLHHFTPLLLHVKHNVCRPWNCVSSKFSDLYYESVRSKVVQNGITSKLVRCVFRSLWHSFSSCKRASSCHATNSAAQGWPQWR